MRWLEFELVYLNNSVLHISYNTMGILFSTIFDIVPEFLIKRFFLLF